LTGAGSLPVVRAHEVGAGLEVKKDSTAGNSAREYQISAQIKEGELSARDEVTIVDNLHVGLSFQGFRSIAAGWS
jgi:hypothetical protein